MTQAPIRLHVETGDRPITLNAERKASRYHRATNAKKWKKATADALLERKITGVRFERVDIRIRPFYPPKSGHLPDTGGLQPTEKAIVDALVTAQIIADDNRHHVRSITSQAPEITDRVTLPRMVVLVEPCPIAEPHPPRRVCGCADRHLKGSTT